MFSAEQRVKQDWYHMRIMKTVIEMSCFVQHREKDLSFPHLLFPVPLIAQSFQCQPSLHGPSDWLKTE